MTIDEYLSLANKLRDHVQRCEEKHRRMFLAATSSPTNIGREGATMQGRAGYNSMERKMVADADAARELIKANKVYSEYCDQLRKDIYNLRYWEGLLIEQVYIENPRLGRNPWQDVEYILDTSDRKKIIAKIDEAKRDLVAIMRMRGVDIDYSNRIKKGSSGNNADPVQDATRSGNSNN